MAEFTNVRRVLFQVSDLMPESPSGPTGTSAHGPQAAATEDGGKFGQHRVEEKEVNAMPSLNKTNIADNGAFPERFLDSNLAETSTVEQSLNETAAPIADKQSGVVEGGKDESMEDLGAEEAFPERVAALSPSEAKNNNPKHLFANNNNNNNNGAAAAAAAAEVPASQPAAASPGPAHTGDNPFVIFPYSPTPGEDYYSNPFAKTLNRGPGLPASRQATIRLLTEEGGLFQNTITTFNGSTALLNACGYDFANGPPVPRMLLKQLRARPFVFPRTGLNPFMGAKLGRDWGHPAELMMRAPSVMKEVEEGVRVPDVLPSTIVWGTVFVNGGLGIRVTREWLDEIGGGDVKEMEVDLRDLENEDGMEGVEVERGEDV